MSQPHKPTRAEMLAAADKTVPDVIAPRLRILFCGINPGLYSAAIGHHFGRPGNRFWPTMHAAGFTDRLLSPYEDGELIRLGYGITNLVERATANADELAAHELVEGGHRVVDKVLRYEPRVLAVVGVTAYRTAFKQPAAALGLQEACIGETAIWVLPNPSGLNAHYSLEALAQVYRELRAWAGDA